MISKAYVVPDFEIVEFSLEDVLTKSSVVHTTAGSTTTTLPGTTSGGIQSGDNLAQGDIVFNPSEYFQ
jgi:hypothetical protein